MDIVERRKRLLEKLAFLQKQQELEDLKQFQAPLLGHLCVWTTCDTCDKELTNQYLDPDEALDFLTKNKT